MKIHISKTKVALACSLALMSFSARSLKASDPADPPSNPVPTTPAPPAPAPAPIAVPTIAGTTFDIGRSFRGTYRGAVEVTPPGPVVASAYVQVAGKSGRDFGRWLCTNCTLGSFDQFMPSQITEMFTDVLNKTIWQKIYAQWRLGDSADICDGTFCVTVNFIGYTTDPWIPKDIGAFHLDDHKPYKNPSGYQVNGDAPDPDTLVPVLYSGVNPTTSEWIQLLLYDQRKWTITVGPMEIVPDQPLPFLEGGSACVQVDSILPGGLRAGDIRAGDVLQLGDGVATDSTGVVSYSETKRASGVRVCTRSGISLICSADAPIMTDNGYVSAPELLGKRIATRRDAGGLRCREFEAVESVESVGLIDIQHITVGNRAFWAGERQDAYILHHNMKQIGGAGGDTSSWCSDPSWGC